MCKDYKSIKLIPLFTGLIIAGLSLTSCKSVQEDKVPVLSVEKVQYGTVVSIRDTVIPGLVLDVWCYEDALGDPVSYHNEGNTLVLIDEPLPDGVDIKVNVKGTEAGDVQKVRNLNPCCQLERSASFKSTGNYVDDFVARCFIYLDKGMTYLSDTKRIPGTIEDKSDKANDPKPWIQEYYPTWRRHPGQIQGQRGYSTDRPVYPVIGAVSRDRKYLVAVAWPETMRLGQVWHHCIHPRPIIGESYDNTKGEINTHGKIYLMANDGEQLLAKFKKDFPEWRRPPDIN